MPTRPESDNVTKFTSVILAGERAARDALRDHTGVACKALLEIGGTPMIRRVIGALRAADEVHEIRLSGPDKACVASDAPLADLIETGEIAWYSPGPTPSTSAHAMLQAVPPDRPVLITTADHPLLTPQIVDHFCRDGASGGYDVVIGLAPYPLVRDAFPDLKKTVLRFRDGQFCGCNLFAFLTPEGRRMADFWRQVEKDRKKPLVVIRLLGAWALFRYKMGWLTLDRALTLLSRKAGLRVGAVILPYAHASVDVDSVEDYLHMRRYAAGPAGDSLPEQG